MRVHLKDLTPKLQVHIRGNEAWLAPLYADFPKAMVTDDGAPPSRPLLTADFKLLLEEAGSVQVSGEIRFAPIVNCSRCDRELAWPLKIPLNVRFLPAAYNSVSKETNLSLADLDVYYLDGDELDLEELINDSVQTALPTRLVPADDSGTCGVCQEPAESGLVYGHGDLGGEASPFAALKGLKLPN